MTDHQLLDATGHVAYLILFAGTFLVGARQREGWIYRAGAELAWVGIGVSLGLTSVWLWGLIFAGNDLVGWAGWEEEE